MLYRVTKCDAARLRFSKLSLLKFGTKVLLNSSTLIIVLLPVNEKYLMTWAKWHVEIIIEMVCEYIKFLSQS